MTSHVASGEVTDERYWWQRPFRVFQTNLRETDAALDVEDVVRTIRELGANTWLLNVGGIVSFYPSALEFQHPSPWLRERPSGDLIADALGEAHRNDINVIARLDFSKVHRDVAQREPGWCFVDVDGGFQVYNDLFSTCPSGPYYQSKSFDVLGEVLDRYPIDGFFFNWFNFNQRDYSGRDRGICQCSACKERFTKETGMRLPRVCDWTDPAYLAWLDYVRHTLSALAGRLRVLINGRRPEVPLILRDDPNVIMHEVNDAVDRPEPLWVNSAGELCRQSRTEYPEKPVMINTVTFLDLPYRFSAEQPGFIALDIVQTISQGANPSSYIIGTPERADERVLETTKTIFQFHRTHEEYYDGLVPRSRVALLTAPRSEEVYGGARAATKVVDEWKGLYRALVEMHVPFDILSDRHIVGAAADGRLQRYAALVLANLAALSPVQATALDHYVAEGGCMLATYETGRFDADGNEQPAMQLQSLGAGRVSFQLSGWDHIRSSYLAVTDPNDIPGSNPFSRIALDDAYLNVEERSGSSHSMAFIAPSRYGPPEKIYGEVETVYPGVVHYRYGKGATAYFPWPLGGTYFRLGQRDVRELLRAMLLKLTGPLQVETNAPPQVEVVVAAQPHRGRTLVHLINYSGHQGRAFYDPLPLTDVELSLRGEVAFSRSISLQLGIELELHKRNDGVGVVLPHLSLFDALVFE